MIIDYVTESTGVSIEEITSLSQLRTVCDARGLLCAALSRYSDMEFKDLLRFVDRTDNAVSSLIVKARKGESWKRFCEEVKKW